MANVSLLERQKIPDSLALPPPQFDELQQLLAQEAAEHLGYRLPQRQINSSNRERDKVHALLELSKLGIELFTNESVRRYEIKVLEELNAPIHRHNQRRERRRIKIAVLFFVLLFMCLLAGIYTEHPACLVGMAVALLGSALSAIWDIRMQNTYWWQTTDICKYGEPIPEHTLQRAISIKKALPEAEFYVCHVDTDPLMQMRYRGHNFWIDVWDEQKFEAEVLSQ